MKTLKKYKSRSIVLISCMLLLYGFLPLLSHGQNTGILNITGNIVPGNAIEINYDPASGPLKNELIYVNITNINLGKRTTAVKTIQLLKNNGEWKATYKIPKNQDMLGMFFHNANINLKLDDKKYLFKLNRAVETMATEKDYDFFIDLYTDYGTKKQVDALIKKKKRKFKNGEWLKAEYVEKFKSAGTTDSMLLNLKILLKKYPLILSEKDYSADVLYSTVAMRLAEERRWKDYELYRSKLSAHSKMETDKYIAAILFKKQSELNVAESLALRALEDCKKTANPANFQKGEGLESMQLHNNDQYQYIQTLLLYANIAYQNKHYKEAFPYAKEAALDLLDGKEAKPYELYLKLFAKTQDPVQAMKSIETHLRAVDAADDEFKDILKGLYAASNKLSVDVENLYSSLNDSLSVLLRTQLLKEKISKPAPDFNLKNLDGQMVRLSDLKGKTVVLDFWATWCVYCKKSFPAMQKMIDKYKSNDRVVFLFIDTRESHPVEADREKEISGYITSHKFNFNVLYDTKPTKGGDDFETVRAFNVTGLPTKIVIGPDGRINFFELGYNGSEDELIRKLSVMIDLTM